jgi:membrane associated rhomboid family serine protease
VEDGKKAASPPFFHPPPSSEMIFGGGACRDPRTGKQIQIKTDMVFPIGDDKLTGRYFPLFSYAFIALNVLAFFYQISVGPDGQDAFFQQWAAIPAQLTSGSGYQGLFTSMFLHGGWMHLIGNMLYLWIFADNIEAKVGNIPFLLFYVIGGVIAAAGHILIDPSSTVPMVGASGAISAVMGAYVIMFPKSRIKMIFLIFFSIFYVPAWAFLGFWFAQQIFSGFSDLGAQGGGVAWWAHIGGFAFGLIWGFLFKDHGQDDDSNYTDPDLKVPSNRFP